MSANNEITNVLRELEPTVESLYNRHDSMAVMWYPHQYVPYDEGQNFGRVDSKGKIELPGTEWNESDSKLSEVAQISWLVNLLTEDNLPSYHYEIATKFGRDGAWGNWVHRWTAEENRHGVAMREYAHVTRAIDPILLENIRMHHMGQGYDSGDKNPLEAIAYVTMQELATRVAHRNTGKAAAESGDIRAEQLLSRISTDENLHMVFYRDLGQAALQIAPDLMMRAIANEVKGFKMPGKTIPNFKEYAAKIALADIYNHRLHRDDVLDPILNKKWKITEIGGLTDDGNRAQQEIGEALEILDDRIKDFDGMQQAYREYLKQNPA